MSERTVFAVAGGKGGVGKTTTSVNVATAIAGGGYEVAVVDADLGMANMSGFISLDPDDATLHDVLADRADLAEATYEVTDGIVAVPSGDDLDTYAKTDASGIADVVDDLRARFDVVFLDVGAGISHETVVPIQAADAVVLVATPEPAAVENADKTAELVERADGEIEGLVLTRTRADDGVDYGALADRIGVELLATIPDDDAVRQSLYEGIPVVVTDPETPASEAYRRLAVVLTDRVSGMSIEAAAGERA